MDAVFENNVLETSTSTGTGALVLAPVPGFRRFRDALTVGKPCHYIIKEVDVVGRPTGAYEAGFGTYSAQDTLARAIVVESSSLGNLVNFSNATKTVAFTSLAPNTTRAREDWQNALQLSFAGAVVYTAMNTPPAGWLKCNGAAVSRATYARLFAAIGTYYGAGDGASTFALPDLRGEFLRGWDDGRTLDNGRVFGSLQGGSNLSHSHGVSDPGHAHGVYDPGHIHSAWTDAQGTHTHATMIRGSDGGTVSSGRWDNNIPQFGGDPNVRTDGAGSHGHNVGIGASATGIGIYGAGTGISIQADGGIENRPRNVAMLACIKF